MIVEFPAIGSKFVTLKASDYDHHIGIPLATSKSDFKQLIEVLFYTDRTENYQGQRSALPSNSGAS